MEIVPDNASGRSGRVPAEQTRIWLWLALILPTGALAFELCILMGAERFVAEFWRIGPRGPAGLSPSQWFALGLCAIGVVGWLEATRRSRRLITPMATPALPR